MYKYLCTKDYWMEYESEANGDLPAFKAGEVYLFKIGEDMSYLVTDKDHTGDIHYMDKDDEFDQYFELVGGDHE